MQQRNRVRVGVPLTPQSMNEIGELEQFPQSNIKYDPAGSWSLAYRIWGCHGYKKHSSSGNKNMGFLRLSKSVVENDRFMLTVHQDTINDSGIINRIKASVTCSNDELATPQKWTLTSDFISSENRLVKELCTEEQASVDGNTLKIKTKNREFSRPVGAPLTAEWTLFEAVQRLSYKAALSIDFHLLENLSVIKPGQHLYYRGKESARINDKILGLHRFDHIGRGNLPWEYWLDDDHRLLAVISMDKTYWLNDQAEAALELSVQRQKERYLRRKNR